MSSLSARCALCLLLAAGGGGAWAETPTPTPTPATGREALADFAKRTRLRATPTYRGSIQITDETLALMDDTGTLTYVLEPAGDASSGSIVVQQPEDADAQKAPASVADTTATPLDPASFPPVLEWRPTRSSDYSPYADYTVTITDPYGANDPLGCHDFSILSLEVRSDALIVVTDRPLDPRCDFSSILEVSSGGSVIPGSAVVVLGGEEGSETPADDRRYVYSPDP